MKSEGFLDDIEKIVDDFSEEKKSQINNHVNSPLDWGKMLRNMHRQDHEESMDRFQREYIQQYKGEYIPTYPKRKEAVKCRCGVKIEIFFTTGEDTRPNYNNYYDWTSSTREVTREVDHFSCPRCGERFRIIGKVTDLKVKMTE